MPDEAHPAQIFDVYKDGQRKWGLGINRLNFNIENYKTARTKIFLYTLWCTLLFTYLFECLINFLFLVYMSQINRTSQAIFIFSISDLILVLILTSRTIYAYAQDKSNLLQKSAKLFFILSFWCFLKLLFYVSITILYFILPSNEKGTNSLLYNDSARIYFSYIMEVTITTSIVKFVLTLFTGQKIQYIFSCIRTSTILKSKIRKDLEKQSFLFDDYTYGTFMTDFWE
ncbi:conserved Plasmodium protein, unknown function [Plasmodium ovale]|uniref:Uncharacterized protein n=1 Tax=Plasmodium ovale TaxID=36330 RepID=A0A1D3TGI3_PLAOA|nr:conserved Plasmodium protein, unknown function [Plasmodium ovale]